MKELIRTQIQIPISKRYFHMLTYSDIITQLSRDLFSANSVEEPVAA